MVRGYRRAHFDDAFERYLQLSVGEDGATQHSGPAEPGTPSISAANTSAKPDADTPSIAERVSGALFCAQPIENGADFVSAPDAPDESGVYPSIGINQGEEQPRNTDFIHIEGETPDSSGASGAETKSEPITASYEQKDAPDTRSAMEGVSASGSVSGSPHAETPEAPAEAGADRVQPENQPPVAETANQPRTTLTFPITSIGSRWRY
jgi:hypothetical protein